MWASQGCHWRVRVWAPGFQMEELLSKMNKLISLCGGAVMTESKVKNLLRFLPETSPERAIKDAAGQNWKRRGKHSFAVPGRLISAAWRRSRPTRAQTSASGCLISLRFSIFAWREQMSIFFISLNVLIQFGNIFNKCSKGNFYCSVQLCSWNIEDDTKRTAVQIRYSVHFWTFSSHLTHSKTENVFKYDHIYVHFNRVFLPLCAPNLTQISSEWDIPTFESSLSWSGFGVGPRVK